MNEENLTYGSCLMWRCWKSVSWGSNFPPCIGKLLSGAPSLRIPVSKCFGPSFRAWVRNFRPAKSFLSTTSPWEGVVLKIQKISSIFMRNLQTNISVSKRLERNFNFGQVWMYTCVDNLTAMCVCNSWNFRNEGIPEIINGTKIFF